MLGRNAYLHDCGYLKWSGKCWICHGKPNSHLSSFGKKKKTNNRRLKLEIMSFISQFALSFIYRYLCFSPTQGFRSFLLAATKEIYFHFHSSSCSKPAVTIVPPTNGKAIPLGQLAENTMHLKQDGNTLHSDCPFIALAQKPHPFSDKFGYVTMSSNS